MRKPIYNYYLPGPVAQTIASPAADPGVMGSVLAWSHTFLKTDLRPFSFSLIQEGLLSVISESICTKYCLTV